MIEIEGIAPPLGEALSKRGYSQLTPVQCDVLAPELTGADMLVSAQTGSGKTVAFGLALAPTLLAGENRFVRAGAPLALVVAPTRELALQVRRELEWLYEMAGASVASCVGGMDMRSERRALERGAHIVVGTPGRLRDHIERGSLDISGLRAVVLDEADEMLDLGFREDLEYILDAAPGDRRTLMFSATVPRAIATLAKRYQRNAVRVTTAGATKQHGDIEYRALTIAPNDLENAIINVLRYFEAQNALVFCGTRAMVNHMTSRFINRGFNVVALSGELSQAERTHALQAMRDGRARVCIATDVAARGIDLPNLELVIHADLPKNGDSLLHRSGRTGRAGRKGVSVLMVPHNARRRAERLLRSAGIEAAWASPPSVEDIMRRDDERILADPVLSEVMPDEEYEFARQLVARYGPEQIAAAFVRLYRAGQSAPEELLDAAPAPAKVKQRDDFVGGAWFSLSIGRKQSAEPRWLLPMLCRGGHLTKRDIGAIRIDHDVSYVELAANCIDRFLAALGPGRTVEKGITVTRLDAPPTLTRDTPADAKRPGKQDYDPSASDYTPRGTAKPKSRRQPSDIAAGRPTEASGQEDFAVPSAPKKKHKRKIARANKQTTGPKKPGQSYLKRKKLKKTKSK